MQGARVWWKDWAVWLLVASPVLVFVPATAGGLLPPGLMQTLGLIGYNLASCGAAAIAWRAGACSPDATGTGFAWRYGAVGYGLLAAGDLLFTVAEVAGLLWLRTIALVMFFLMYPLFVWVLLKLARGKFSRSLRLRLSV
ncbi:MAG TPA: hypothetical protein VD902_11900, partial [Symbiobacteriaceae bacterium]|nr:hypothetical protein [Symbiobacteriaceae bacterium]